MTRTSRRKKLNTAPGAAPLAEAVATAVDPLAARLADFLREQEDATTPSGEAPVGAMEAVVSDLARAASARLCALFLAPDGATSIAEAPIAAAAGFGAARARTWTLAPPLARALEADDGRACRLSREGAPCGLRVLFPGLARRLARGAAVGLPGPHGLVGALVLATFDEVEFSRDALDQLTRVGAHLARLAESAAPAPRTASGPTSAAGRRATRPMPVPEDATDIFPDVPFAAPDEDGDPPFPLAAVGANDGLWSWAPACRRMQVSARWKFLLGYHPHELGDTPDHWLGRVHPADIQKLRLAISRHLRGGLDHFACEHRLLHRDGTWRWMLARGVAHRNRDGAVERIAGSLSDIHERKSEIARIVHESLHDSLTGLPNRVLFTDRLKRCVEMKRRRKGYLFAVLFLDLDRFKIINDSLGHAVGDQLLVHVAAVLQRAVRGVDTVARLGGDEFAILLDELRDVSDAHRVAERIQAELSAPLDLGGHQVFTNASMGIALSGGTDDGPEALMRDADAAMYRAKSLGRANHQIFDSEMHARALDRLRLEGDLRRAVERREFVLFYQPIISLVTGHICGFEALIRWKHPEQGMISPLDFIPVAEETGLIVPIGAWVAQEACHQLRRWRDRHRDSRPLWMSINLSARQFADPGLTDDIERILRTTGVPPACLKLEITESVIMDNVQVATAVLERLKAQGLLLSIDDFGTGYSSLSTLHRFPIDTLKIDRSFVRHMHSGDGNPEIVRTIVSLARNLGMEVVAEGVETVEHLRELRALTCDYAQGYYFAKPMEAQRAGQQLLRRPEW